MKKITRWCNYLLAFSILFIINTQAKAQEIVLDPVLNKALVTFQQQFPQFIQQKPELTSGVSPEINLNGGKGKTTFTFQQQGQYLIDYDSLQFSPTTPISRNTFQITLKLKDVSLMGNAALMIMAKGKNFNLQCSNNIFIVNNLAFTSLVQVDRMNVALSNTQVNFDPKAITISIPCLKKNDNQPTEAILEEITPEEITPDLTKELTTTIVNSMTTVFSQGDQPTQGTINKVSSSLQTSATQTNSSVSMAASSTSMSSSMAVATNATSPCGGNVNNDAKLVIMDLSNIAAQANANGFRTAIQDFINVLKSILPTLSQPSQQVVQKFINDLNAAIADGQISTLEQITLSNDLYNLVISTGITSSQLTLITDSLANVLSTLSGISTTQLKTDLQKLVTDAQACLKQ